jgi:hypothetical protein
MTAVPPYDPAFADRALAAGRQGKSRAEIAVELQIGLKALKALEDAHADFARALDLADAEARAWWDALPRQAVVEGDVFHPAVWAKAVAHRFGSAAHRQRPETEAAPDVPEAIIRLPDNGTRRKPPPSRRGR